MVTPLAVPVGLSMLFGGAFLLNEWAHGGLSEMMGLGHHHAFDFGGYHCASHDDAAHAVAHLEHMHGNRTRSHAACPGGGGMHGSGSHMGGA